MPLCGPTGPGRTTVALLFAGIVVAAGFSFALSKDRSILWRIAHDKCVPDEKVHHNPAPCVRVVLAGGEAHGYVLLKDLHGVAQFLLIPTQRVSGIESPAILASDAPNYFADAWANRDLVAARLHHDLAWDMIGLAINSAAARSQDQLHIHIDCVKPEVRRLLAAHLGEIGTGWKELGFDLAGRRYVARRLSASDFPQENPFKLLARSLKDAEHEMGRETLAVIGVFFTPHHEGFVLLAAKGASTPGMGAHSEDLLDHGCAVASAR